MKTPNQIYSRVLQVTLTNHICIHIPMFQSFERNYSNPLWDTCLFLIMILLTASHLILALLLNISFILINKFDLTCVTSWSKQRKALFVHVVDVELIDLSFLSH